MDSRGDRRHWASAYGGGCPTLWFARLHWGVAAALFALAGAVELVLERDSLGISFQRTRLDEPELFGWSIGPLAVLGYLGMAGLARLIEGRARLSAFETPSAEPALRVRRALYFHAVHFVPVALVMAGTVCGYFWLMDSLRMNEYLNDAAYPFPALWRAYHITLAAEIVAGLIYLAAMYRLTLAALRCGREVGT